MKVQFTCEKCGSGINVYPSSTSTHVECDICGTQATVKFNEDHEKSILEDCPKCERKDFYQQRDFNRKIGVVLFVIAAILSIWTYGISFIVLYVFDFILFRKLSNVAICYKCQTCFRDVKNMGKIPGFDHEMNDRIVYSDHDFQGKPLSH